MAQTIQPPPPLPKAMRRAALETIKHGYGLISAVVTIASLIALLASLATQPAGAQPTLPASAGPVAPSLWHAWWVAPTLTIMAMSSLAWFSVLAMKEIHGSATQYFAVGLAAQRQFKLQEAGLRERYESSATVRMARHLAEVTGTLAGEEVSALYVLETIHMVPFPTFERVAETIARSRKLPRSPHFDRVVEHLAEILRNAKVLEADSGSYRTIQEGADVVAVPPEPAAGAKSATMADAPGLDAHGGSPPLSAKAPGLTGAEITAVIEHLRGPTCMVSLGGGVLFSPVRFLRFYGKGFIGAGMAPSDALARCKRDGLAIDRHAIDQIYESLRFKRLITGGQAAHYGLVILDPRARLTQDGEQVVGVIMDLPNGHELV